MVSASRDGRQQDPTQLPYSPGKPIRPFVSCWTLVPLTKLQGYALCVLIKWSANWRFDNLEEFIIKGG